MGQQEKNEGGWKIIDKQARKKKALLCNYLLLKDVVPVVSDRLVWGMFICRAGCVSTRTGRQRKINLVVEQTQKKLYCESSSSWTFPNVSWISSLAVCVSEGASRRRNQRSPDDIFPWEQRENFTGEQYYGITQESSHWAKHAILCLLIFFIHAHILPLIIYSSA